MLQYHFIIFFCFIILLIMKSVMYMDRRPRLLHNVNDLSIPIMRENNGLPAISCTFRGQWICWV